MVARLKGVALDYETAQSGYTKGNMCITHNRRPSLVVLEKRFQCVPLVQYPTELFATNHEGLGILSGLQSKIQNLLDENCNGDVSVSQNLLSVRSYHVPLLFAPTPNSVFS
jgi:hypothetical protein